MVEFLHFIDHRSLQSRDLRRGYAAARLLLLRVRIPPGIWMAVSCEYCVLSGRVLCDGPILSPEEPYRVCMCVLLSEQVKQ